MKVKQKVDKEDNPNTLLQIIFGNREFDRKIVHEVLLTANKEICEKRMERFCNLTLILPRARWPKYPGLRGAFEYIRIVVNKGNFVKNYIIFIDKEHVKSDDKISRTLEQ